MNGTNEDSDGDQIVAFALFTSKSPWFFQIGSDKGQVVKPKLFGGGVISTPMTFVCGNFFASAAVQTALPQPKPSNEVICVWGTVSSWPLRRISIADVAHLTTITITACVDSLEGLPSRLTSLWLLVRSKYFSYSVKEPIPSPRVHEVVATVTHDGVCD